jgi:hypothetical protein
MVSPNAKSGSAHNFYSYEALVQHFPEVPEYKVHLAHSLHKAGQHDAALAVAQSMDRPEDAAVVCDFRELFESIPVGQSTHGRHPLRAE